MSTSGAIDAVTEQLQAGISLLEELHVLSQTQTLLLESGNLPELKAIVEAKKVLVDRIMDAERRLASLRQAAGAGGSGVLEQIMLKERALHLIERISAVEQKNHHHLETLKADVIRRSRVLQENRKVQQSYGPFENPDSIK